MIKYKATGIYLPAFNKSGIQNLLSAKKNILVLGSAHNRREIKEKINQGCDAVFVSPVFQTKNSKTKFYALGGINHKNLKKIKILNAVGFSGISLYKKKPAQINGPVL